MTCFYVTFQFIVLHPRKSLSPFHILFEFFYLLLNCKINVNTFSQPLPQSQDKLKLFSNTRRLVSAG
ncbi:hypothetical protein D66 [Sulfolobus turreted icosahedral virus 1]|uniref:Uncharacterized protein n=1 Tax=Sulfolobus turreted icosahedral virus 1 TaxID=269145 RepID=Q6Q0L2_9VIRU|nr:hypothetical protein D66 [Sulfolobus turreted icosahedral virus 1]AAS89079.1 hypothetical protein D66 [Sulfolobus turreted icosahedral virus 1]